MKPQAKLAAAAISLLLIGASSRGDTSTNFDHILANLSRHKDELVGYAVSEIRTNFFFAGGDRTLKPEALKVLKAYPDLLDKVASGQTSVVSQVWRFQKDLVWQESFTRDLLGRPLHDLRTVATRDTVFTFDASMDERLGPAGSSTPSGEVSLRPEGFLSGSPFCLGRGRLGDWLRDCIITRCAQAVGTNGESCYELELRSPEASPKTYTSSRLILRASDFTPLEFFTYDSNGAIASSAEIQYGEFEGGLLLCKRMVGRSFRRNQIYSLGVRELLSVERAEPHPAPTIASFFPMGTIISDKRFSKPISYRLGTRPPMDAEIQRMLTNRTGVPLYEAATNFREHAFPLPRDRGIGKKRVIVAALLVLLIGPAIMLAAKKCGRRRTA